MGQTRTLVPTPNGSRYLQQVCKHWSHRFTATFDPAQGRVDFGDSDVVLTARDDALDILVTGPDDQLGDLESVVAEHVNRFAHREGELAFDWQRS